MDNEIIGVEKNIEGLVDLINKKWEERDIKFFEEILPKLSK